MSKYLILLLLKTSSFSFSASAQKDDRSQQLLIAEQNKIEGKIFLATNKQHPNVISLPSGLQYTVIKQGTGLTPYYNESVIAHYRGNFIDGTEFDSSYKTGKPLTFPVNRVIDGWTEALQLMKEGAHWKLFIPSELAYGRDGDGGLIAPNATLIFDIELISVVQ